MRFEKGLIPAEVTKTKRGNVLQLSENKEFAKAKKTEKDMGGLFETGIWRHLRAYFVTNMTPSVLPCCNRKKK